VGAAGAAGAQAASRPTPTKVIVPVRNARRDTPGDIAIGPLLRERRPRRSLAKSAILADRDRPLVVCT
jgi:hypothetical protein